MNNTRTEAHEPHIDYGLADTLLLGAIPEILLSTHISLRAPASALHGALAVVLLGAGLGMLAKAGVPVPSVVLAIAPAIVFVLVGGAVAKASTAKRTGLQQIPVRG